MKKLFLIGFLVAMTLAVSAQNIFQPVPDNLFSTEKAIKAGAVDHMWLWRFDATVALAEFTYVKEIKQFTFQEFSAVGPAIGFQHYVVSDTGPFNNYGVSAAVLLGKSIYNPDMAALKVALIGNFFQYFKGGVSYTPNATDHWAVLLGGGITF
jgi:hypothetical protein